MKNRGLHFLLLLSLLGIVLVGFGLWKLKDQMTRSSEFGTLPSLLPSFSTNNSSRFPTTYQEPVAVNDEEIHKQEVQAADASFQYNKEHPFYEKLPIETADYFIMYDTGNERLIIGVKHQELTISQAKQKYLPEIEQRLLPLGLSINQVSNTYWTTITP